MSCNGRNSEIRDAVDAVNKTTPAKSWDSEKFESVAFDAEDNVVIFEIANVYPDAQMNDSADNQRKTGIWYISNFMTAYGYVKDGSDDCEGDAEMFRAVGSLLKLMVENEVGARFKFYFSEGGSFSCDLSPKDVKKAVRMRKEDYYDEFGSR